MANHPQAYSANLELFGRRLAGTSRWEWIRCLGFVSPELHLHFAGNQTVRAVLASGLDDAGCARRGRRRSRTRSIATALSRFGLGAMARRSFDSISAGEQRLVLLARAVIKAPRLLIADEPFQGLDREARYRVLETLNLLAAEGTQLVLVTHSRGEIPASITHELRLVQGRVSYAGPRSAELRRSKPEPPQS
jgi:molybdate transport system ATP-binding protein